MGNELPDKNISPTEKKGTYSITSSGSLKRGETAPVKAEVVMTSSQMNSNSSHLCASAGRLKMRGTSPTIKRDSRIYPQASIGIYFTGDAERLPARMPPLMSIVWKMIIINAIGSR